MTSHTDIIPKLFISFTDATMAEQLEAMTAKLKHTQQQLAQMSQEFRLLAMSVLFHCCNSITVLHSSLLFNLTTFSASFKKLGFLKMNGPTINLLNCCWVVQKITMFRLAVWLQFLCVQLQIHTNSDGCFQPFSVGSRLQQICLE